METEMWEKDSTRTCHQLELFSGALLVGTENEIAGLLVGCWIVDGPCWQVTRERADSLCGW